MNNLTESEKIFFEVFEKMGRKPYLGFLVGLVLLYVGATFYSKGIRLEGSGYFFFAGMFVGLALFEMIESYILYRLYRIIEKIKPDGNEWEKQG